LVRCSDPIAQFRKQNLSIARSANQPWQRRNDGRFGEFYGEEIFRMYRHGQELLDKRSHGPSVAPRADGVMIVGLLAIFLTGILLGSFLYAYSEQPMRMALNDTTPAMSFPHAPLQIKRQ
jgi:hypothetical protein